MQASYIFLSVCFGLAVRDQSPSWLVPLCVWSLFHVENRQTWETLRDLRNSEHCSTGAPAACAGTSMAWGGDSPLGLIICFQAPNFSKMLLLSLCICAFMAIAANSLVWIVFVGFIVSLWLCGAQVDLNVLIMNYCWVIIQVPLL